MEIKEVTDKYEWEGFLSQCAEKTFLQSWNWGEFNEKMGSKVWRFGAYQGDSLLAVALVLKISARRGTFLFIPHGPCIVGGLVLKDKKEIFVLLLAHLAEIAKEEKANFIRFSPISLRNTQDENIFNDLGFRDAPIHMHPETTWELDITPSEDDILAGMRKTTRYLVRQGIKNEDVEIIKSINPEDLKLFWPVYQETAKRHNFVVFSEKYLQSEFECFSGDREIMMFLGKYKGETVSAAIFIFWQGTCFYHHSGSLSKFNKIPVSYLLQWGAIKEAKSRGCNLYNFWGIAPGIDAEEDAVKSSHPWAGLSLFKMGFGGARKDYIKTKDFVLSWKYWINYIIETLRKRKRNL